MKKEVFGGEDPRQALKREEISIKNQNERKVHL